ncbi:MAG TPA: hypothetical protein VK680_07055 [Solirubrobacteraceae bacterium]|jgi:hypothetical protein|nr:hypothetical protein [Solirubrobacteraceae bacterium]
MGSDLVIPVGVVALVREGAYALVRGVAEDIDNAKGVGELFAARDRLCEVCALIERIEYAASEQPREVELGVREHAGMLTAVLGLMLPLMEEWLAGLPGDDPTRPEREMEYRSMRELQARVGRVFGWSGRAVVPGEVVVALRDGLVCLLAEAALDVDAVAVSAAHLRVGEWGEPVARFDRVRSVLDLIGWEHQEPEPDVEVELCWYGQTVVDALVTELGSMRDLAESDDGEQHERATRKAGAIERFLATLESQP